MGKKADELADEKAGGWVGKKVYTWLVAQKCKWTRRQKCLVTRQMDRLGGEAVEVNGWLIGEQTVYLLGGLISGKISDVIW